ncbi:helix-turn-helix transcriptional regulator [Albimonas sp. CAU 1670]|uniref:helix-turn-helix transcriptional regulator n=1 Tax=Albimonas sp. CAU 1670 TaxID=3032599 RepID=UPI0023D98929|nr:helix-turn-helix transcriptional regulator [Albimonas sp. CAU 1670]MDF2235393.1 helix-turn-helix transcriptional regulator [Albimonas sp. CAU 1670]
MHPLATYRAEKNQTQAALAHELGVSQSFVSMLETGRELPGLRLAQRIEALTEGSVPCSVWVNNTKGTNSTERPTLAAE